MQEKNITTSSGGYAILFAVLLVSIILAITLGILNIAIKEFNFTATAKNSHVSFFAADTGGECALYGRKQGMLASANPSMLCDTQTITSTNTASLNGVTQFVFTPITVQDGCALVDITIDNSNSLITRTTINSHGYNVTCPVLIGQNPMTKVERLLSYEFTEGGTGGGSGGSGGGNGSNITTSGTTIGQLTSGFTSTGTPFLTTGGLGPIQNTSGFGTAGTLQAN